MSDQKQGILLFNKTEISSMLGVTHKELNKHLPEEIKQSLNWKPGIQYFSDSEVFKILKYFRGLLSDNEIKQIIYPKGH